MSGTMGADRIKAWQCIGCGRIEAPQGCIGVCQDRRVEFVYASEHRQLEDELARTQARRDALEALLRRLAWTNPRDGEWERAWRGLQQDARRLLRPDAAPPLPTCGGG